MRHKLLTLALLAALPVFGADLLLVENGKPKASIVL